MNNSKKYKYQQTVLEMIVLGLFRLIGVIFRAIFNRPGRRGGITLADKNAVNARRLEIEALLKSENIHEIRQALFEADKLVDHILKLKGYGGESFADRLRLAEDYTDRLIINNIWQGHKIRNQLAHEHNAKITKEELRQGTLKLLHYVKRI